MANSRSARGADIILLNPAIKDASDFLGYDSFRCVPQLLGHLDLDDVVLDGVHHQVADGMKAELPHDVAAMRFHSLGAEVQQ